jgi:6-phosphofructokinase
MVGVPKTIDNDLCHTDRTFGFDSAVAVVAEALDRLETTARSHGRVMIAETMGRYAGWIALEGGMAGGADVILLPELPVDVDAVARLLPRARAREGYTLICIAEGARLQGGELTVRERIADSPDPLRLGGVGTCCSTCCAAAAQRGAHHAAGPCAARRLAHGLRPRAGHALRPPRGRTGAPGPLRPHGHLAGRLHRQRGHQRRGRAHRTVPPDHWPAAHRAWHRGDAGKLTSGA